MSMRKNPSRREALYDRDVRYVTYPKGFPHRKNMSLAITGIRKVFHQTNNVKTTHNYFPA